MAYQAEALVNWCPAQGTVLANEEVKDGKYVETGDVVERRMMRQWMLKITQYADRLLDDLEELDWPESIKAMQRNWIGKSQGAEIEFEVAGFTESFKVFTTRPDTIFGVTFCVLAPEHPLVSRVIAVEKKQEVEAYCERTAKLSDIERSDTGKEKTGVFVGSYAINPLNGKKIPLWIADYVNLSYGTGAVMAVPGHDIRDHEFARKFDLPIDCVIHSNDHIDINEAAYVDGGKLINSGFLDGLSVSEAKAAIVSKLEEEGIGAPQTKYRLRDWLFSRQRYWGEPIPILHLQDGSVVTVSEDSLPVSHPQLDDYHPGEDGSPPLARAKHWTHVTHPETGEPVIRETNRQ